MVALRGLRGEAGVKSVLRADFAEAFAATRVRGFEVSAIEQDIVGLCALAGTGWASGV